MASNLNNLIEGHCSGKRKWDWAGYVNVITVRWHWKTGQSIHINTFFLNANVDELMMLHSKYIYKSILKLSKEITNIQMNNNLPLFIMDYRIYDFSYRSQWSRRWRLEAFGKETGSTLIVDCLFIIWNFLLKCALEIKLIEYRFSFISRRKRAMKWVNLLSFFYLSPEINK